MKDTSRLPQTTRADRGSSFRAKERRDTLWFLASFGFLVAGLAGGTIMFAWRPDWVWPFPVVGFIGYVLTFRRGLLLWNPNIDRAWREYLWLDRSATSEESSNDADDSSRGADSLHSIRPEQPRRSQAGLRAVR